MPSPIYRFELDITGKNPDNLVVGEPHVLSDKPVRAITPKYGPFFSEHLFLVDTITGKELKRNIHYRCANLLQTASLDYAAEIHEVILITDKNVSSHVAVDYQVLGGPFMNSSTAIANLYELVINDNRPVLWENLINVPLQQPSVLHPHLLKDVIGWEYIVAMLERLRQAVILGNIPAFEALIDYIKSMLGNLTCQEAMLNIPNKKVMRYDKFLVVMTRMWLLSNYKFGQLPLHMHETSACSIPVISKDTPDNTRVYWEIIHDNTDASDFIQTSGSFLIKGNRGTFIVEIAEDAAGEIDEKFMVGLKHHPSDPDYCAVSCYIRVTNARPVLGEIPPMWYEEDPFCLLGPNDQYTVVAHYMAHVKGLFPLSYPAGKRDRVIGQIDPYEVCTVCNAGPNDSLTSMSLLLDTSVF